MDDVLAIPLAQRDIPVIPVLPSSKRGFLDDQFRQATTEISQIAQWNRENSDYNVGCVCEPDGIVVLDCDIPGLKQRIENETGRRFPATLTVRSAGKGCDHLYFKQTDVSRDLGNQKRADLFDLQSVDKYVVGPGSRLDNGKTYDVTDGSPIADFPIWLENWILANADVPKKHDNGKDARPVDESFDIGGFLEHYGISYYQDREWYITDICPVAGRKHEQSTRTGFFFDGGNIGFHCFATGCEGSTMTVGEVIKFLNKDHEPFRGEIWEEEPIEDVLDEMGVEPEVGAVRESLSATVRVDAGTPTSTHLPSPPTSEHRSPLAFPEHCMYGEAKVFARQMKMPLGLAYMALIGEFGIRCESDVMCGTRVNTYTALIAPVGGGKNVAMDRAKVSLGLRYKEEYLPAAPAGTRALMNLIGDKPSGKRGSKERSPGPKKLLLVTHEMTDVLQMTGVDCSTLASRLCDFWDDNEHVYPTGKDGVISVDCRLHWIGGVPASAENPTRFTELFDSETSHGLYDRLLIGYSKEKFNYRPWQPPSKDDATIDYSDYTAEVCPVPFVEAMSEAAQKLFDDWNPVGGGSRVKQNCIKVALITTMMNHEETVTEECMRCAIGIMEWQVELRRVFQPGEAVNDEAKCRVAILAAMDAAGAKGVYVNIKRMAHDRKWGNRFGDRIVRNAISNLADMGEIVPQVVETEDGKKKSKSIYKLRDWSLGGGKSGENGERGDSPSTNSQTLVNNLQT
jgi:hypothetical protein